MLDSAPLMSVTPISKRERGLQRRALLGAAAVLAAPHIARAASRVLRMGYVNFRDTQFGTGVAAFSRRLAADGDGRWQIEEYPNGVLGSEIEMLAKLRTGELDLALLSAVSLSTLVPDFGVFDLPFIFRDVPHARAVLDGPVGDEYLGLFRDHDVIGLAWAENGLRHLTNARRPVRTPADLHGLRLRVPESEVTVRCFRQLGAEVATLPFPALYGALEAGRFDGQENPIAGIIGNHIERVQRYLTLTGHVYSGAVIFMSRDLWDDLAPNAQALFVAAAREGGAAAREVAGRAEHDGVALMRAAGLEVVERIDQAAFRAALEPTWSELAERYGAARIARMRAVATG